MNKCFRTEIKSSKSEWDIHHQSPVLTLGSCFAERTGEQLYRWHIPVSLNPWGTIFHPLALENILNDTLSGRPSTLNPVIEQDNMFYSLRYPSYCVGNSPEELQNNILDIQNYISEVFTQFRYIILTLGTAWVYRHRSSGIIVTSCHKVPAREFDKILLTPDQVVQSVAEFVRLARSMRPDIKIILSVSPVRHTRDTLELNSVSKSVLRFACHQITEMLSEIEYFPAYEIMLDDLRDYRFYEADMIHPSKEAVQHIWDFFCARYFTSSTMELNEALESLNLGIEHKTRTSGQAWLKHLNRLEDQAHRISADFNIRMDRELSKIELLKSSSPVI